MSRAKYVAKLLLILFSPLVLIIAARVMHTVYVWALAGIVPEQETWCLALILTVISFVIIGNHALCRWLEP